LNSSRWTELRSEDLLAGGFAIALVVLGGVRALGTAVILSDDEFWEIAMILAPVSVLVFLAAVQYATGGGDALATVRRITGTVRDWLPFASFLLFYSSFRNHLWQLLFRSDRDAQLLAIDRALLGETPAVWLDRWVRPWLTDAMAAAYFSHLILPPVLAFALYRRDRLLFRRLLLAILVAGVIGSVGYLAVPAVGPAVAYPQLFAHPLHGGLFAPLSTLMDAARAPRDVFPSLHVGVSAVVLWYAYRRGKVWFWLFLPWVMGNWAATLYLRYHYSIDVLAGWAVAASAIAITEALLRLEARRSSTTAKA